MPFKRLRHEAARKYVTWIRNMTCCTHCGKRPIEWHNDEHLTNGNRRVAHLATLGYPIKVIKAEIAKCEPLCRACHMKIDGRSAALQASKPRQLGMRLPPKPCAECGKLAKPLRRGLCNRCNHRKRYKSRNSARVHA